LVQPRSLTNRCHSIPSVIDQTTSRHSASDTASCPVLAASAAITPMPARRCRPISTSIAAAEASDPAAAWTISWNGAMR
jgi:hypothetical protein